MKDKFLIRGLNRKKGITQTIDFAPTYLKALYLQYEYQKSWGKANWAIFIEQNKQRKGFYAHKNNIRI